ncbi:hypothetical protein B0T22DRAFT_368657 [Podospora appendiculata]|uniref:Cell wall proline rich protein n=1 Tax=Podospora appendiculata TaxID=314037 RepID=A0AAE0XK14_9PEZI|nr:hypothetical protein B0T22DRAFT_368657 [Podospora appendiculata]
MVGPQFSPKSIVPPPNPPFVFPSRMTSSSAPSSFSRATGRRPRSGLEHQLPVLILGGEYENQKSRSPALPAFSFNPGASLPSASPPDSAFLSPPQSPSLPGSPRSIPIRSTGQGHRRGGSEFVGGSIRGGDSITVLGTSPTKSESGMSSPSLMPANPPRKRGHAHRRSAAISSHDLSSIILPSPGHQLRGNSAPNSPAAVDRPEPLNFPTTAASPSQSESNISQRSEAVANHDEHGPRPVMECQQSPKPVARNRVGFSDNVEYIPRPLSLVSSDASSTATARPGHSVSGSISSVISATNVERELSSPQGINSAPTQDARRPSTAGAILERTQSSQEQEQALQSPRRRGSIPLLGELPLSPVSPGTPSPTKVTKKWSFFSLDPFVASSPTRSRPVSAGSCDSLAKPAVPTRSSFERISDAFSKAPKDEGTDFKPLTKKRSKKQKKVKTWAILSRKSKPRYSKPKRRTPTPPPHRDFDTTDIDRADGTISEIPANPDAAAPTLTVTPDSSDSGDEEPWSHSGSRSVPDEDISYPMIDLDAALGPFNTPLPRNPEWEAAQRARGLIKKQLHSAAGMTRFTGPGMHYHHRRAESAPEMVPFESARFGFPRFGSSSTMADVFEEDEEDGVGSVEKSTGQSTPVVDTPICETHEGATTSCNRDADLSEVAKENALSSKGHLPAPSGPGRKGSDLSENEKPTWGSRTRSNHSATSLPDETVEDSLSRNMAAFQGEYSTGGSGSNSATPSPRHAFRPKDLAPVEVSPLNLPAASLVPISPCSMTQSSTFPSPRSPMSYDAHRISTAPSSITEDNYHSLLMGEPGPEVRISADIPSLTSSNSTMTRESIFAQYPQARQPPLNEQPRPASFSSTPFGRRRSSLASLSRLISSSHGERSKLSMEVTMDSEPEKKVKTSKAKRLSRLVQFWKSKDTETETESA